MSDEIKPAPLAEEAGWREIDAYVRRKNRRSLFVLALLLIVGIVLWNLAP